MYVLFGFTFRIPVAKERPNDFFRHNIFSHQEINIFTERLTSRWTSGTTFLLHFLTFIQQLLYTTIGTPGLCQSGAGLADNLHPQKI